MNDQERLEEIERRTDQLKNISQEVITWQGWKKTYSVLQDDYKYLIEQANQVEEQQQEIERLKSYSQDVEFVASQLKNYITWLEQQNNHYFEVLEFYADAINYVAKDAKTNLTVIQKDGGEKARQELEKCK